MQGDLDFLIEENLDGGWRVANFTAPNFAFTSLLISKVFFSLSHFWLDSLYCCPTFLTIVVFWSCF